VGDQRVVHEGDIVTSAGVSAGIDLALWLVAQIGGEGGGQDQAGPVEGHDDPAVGPSPAVGAVAAKKAHRSRGVTR
jgi:hypothetical protein